jgi:hypothetical protein
VVERNRVMVVEPMQSAQAARRMQYTGPGSCLIAGGPLLASCQPALHASCCARILHFNLARRTIHLHRLSVRSLTTNHAKHNAALCAPIHLQHWRKDLAHHVF